MKWWVTFFGLKKKKRKEKKNKTLFFFDSGSRVNPSAIFSAKSKMADLCPLWPGVRCQGSNVGRLK